MQTPPNYAQYPRPGGTGGGAGYRGPGVYFDFVSEAFRMIMKNPGVYIVAALISLVVIYALQIPVSIVTNIIAYGASGPRYNGNAMPEFNFIALPVSLILGVIPAAVGQALGVGISLCAIEEADTGRTQINTMFNGFKNFLPLIGTSVLYSLAINLGLLFCIIPGLILAGLFVFAPLNTVDRGMNPIEALQKSFESVRAHVLNMILLLIVAGLATFVGVCACGIGLLFTFPIAYIVIGLHYREFRGPLDQGFQTTYTAPSAPDASAAVAPVSPVAEPEPVVEVAPAPEPTAEAAPEPESIVEPSPAPETKPDSESEPPKSPNG